MPDLDLERKYYAPTDFDHFESLIYAKSHSTVFNLRCQKRCVNLVNFTQNNNPEVLGSHLEDPRGVEIFSVFFGREGCLVSGAVYSRDAIRF